MVQCYIKYKFFSKPMSSNLLLMNGTALSKSCVFSSLRQDLVRRLLNTDYSEGIDRRLEIINRFIQLMVNSGHKFQYVKSVVLQAISKYLYMVQRSSVDENNKIFCPLHRARTFKEDQRKLLKYTNYAMWYSKERPGDRYKDIWKSWIKRKGGKKHNNKKETRSKKTTTVMFTPKTSKGRLAQMIQGVEDRIAVDWNTKIVEKPGTPLYTKFNKTFPMVAGCSRGESCKICDNMGTKCTPKGVVYKAVCTQCDGDDLQKGTYIGETSRQFGTRVAEHHYNLFKMRKESFIVSHWMEQHGTLTTPPQFKFEIISSHRDALSRQLCEAILIRKEGNLNRRNEFSLNELVRLETSQYYWDKEMNMKAERDQEKDFNERISNFISVMSSVSRLPNSTKPKKYAKNILCFQNPKRPSQSQRKEGFKRCRMEASTPMQYREQPLLNLSQSPIEVEASEKKTNDTTEEQSGVSSMSHDGDIVGVNTGISGGADKLELTPPKPEPRELTRAREDIASNEFCDSVHKFRTRSNSAPIIKPGIMEEKKLDNVDIDGTCEEVKVVDMSEEIFILNPGLGENKLGDISVDVLNNGGNVSGEILNLKSSCVDDKPEKTTPVNDSNAPTDGGIIELESQVVDELPWEENVRFKMCDDDSTSFEVEELVKSKEDNLTQTNDEGKDDLTQANNEEKDDLTQAKNESAEDLDEGLVQNYIKERSENKLYDIFKKSQLNLHKQVSTPVKRKLSPQNDAQGQTPKLRKRGMDLGNSPGLKHPPIRRVASAPRLRTRSLGSIDPKQKLLTAMFSRGKKSNVNTVKECSDDINDKGQ